MRNFSVVQFLAVMILSACGPAAAPTPSAVHTTAPTVVPAPTHTPEPTPTFQFYASDLVISATAESCAVPPAKIKMCLSGLNVKLSGRKLSQYTVTVSASGFPDTVFDCPEKFVIETFGQYSAPVNCDSAGITFISLGLKEITLKITWESGSTTQTFTPVYEAYAINGPSCNPICSVASIELEIP